jgi:hypothetical protein
MRLLSWCLGATCGLTLAGSLAQAGSNPPYGPYPPYPMRAPDACGPGFYAPNNYGMWYGPNYWLQPGFGPYSGPARSPSGFPPFGGAGGPGAGGPGGLVTTPAFPTHPFARSPRDYFMMDSPQEFLH